MIKNKTIIVTGGAGFIGSHVVKKLVEQEANVIVVDISVSPQSFFAKMRIKKDIVYESVDIRNRKKVLALFQKYSPDYIFHFAAEPIVTVSYDNPYDTFMTNVMGTVNILDASLKNKKTKAVIVSSSDKAYGKTSKPYKETSPLHGDHPYDVSKSCTDLIAQTYYRTYGLPVIVTRFGNVYGEGDTHFDRIIPGICKALLTNTTLAIRSDGSYVRDYVYVKDIASACLFLLQNTASLSGEAFNVSSRSNYSVLGLIKTVEDIMQKEIKYTILNTSKNEIPYQHLVDRKIRKLGWKHDTPFKQAIQNTLAWYAKYVFKKKE